MNRAPLCLMACAEAQGIASAIGLELGVRVTPSRDTWFSCGEGKHAIDANLRGTDVYIFQQPVVTATERSVYDRLVMLLHAIDAARLADADRITAVVPYLPGSRQDKRKGHVREGVSTGLFARLLMAAGVDMVITVEPHNEALIGCYDPRRAVLESVKITGGFSQFLLEQGLGCDVVCSTDVGGLEMAREFAARMGCSLAALSKERDYSHASTVVQTTVIGEVSDRSVLIIDDIVDTGGSVVSAVQALWSEGATDIVVAAAHMVLSGPAWDRLSALRDEATSRGVSFRVAGTGSICHDNAPSWYVSWGLEPLLSRVIRQVNSRGSVRALEAE